MSALVWPEPTHHEEASGDDAVRRVAAAGAAGADVRKDRNALERQAVQDILKYLGDLKKALTHRLLTGAGSLTDFKRFTLQALLADTDRLIADAQRRLAMMTERLIQNAADLGDSHAEEPLVAAKLDVQRSLPGLDQTVIQATFGNTVKLLTPPMAQFADDAKRAIRAVALAGDNKFEAIQKLRDRIAGQGMAAAQYKAERIIRTELGRTFNEATYQRLVALSAQYPFLKKVWRATKDNRTRQGHREAGQAYARGRGVDIKGAFVVNVYDERPGKSPVLQGKVAMRFPVDPLAVPQGKLAASATIMCRCNAAIDFDMADFRQYTRNQVSLGLGGIQPPAPPIPPPVPPAIPKPVPVPTPRKPRTPRVAKPVPPVVPVAQGPTATTVGVPTNLVPGKKTAAGTRVSFAIQVMHDSLKTLAQRVGDAIASVHGDGPLDKIPLERNAMKAFGRFTSTILGSRPVRLEMSLKGLKDHPFNTLTHEIGHFLDLDGVGKEVHRLLAAGMGRINKGWATNIPKGTRQGHYPGLSPAQKADLDRGNQVMEAIDRWRDASASSPTVKAIAKSIGSPAAIRSGGIRKHIRYLLQTDEVWARSYAQYIAIRSNDSVLMAELRRLQTQVKLGRDNPQGFGTRTSDSDPEHKWPTVWEDDEFEPIAAAFDDIFEGLGWRK